MSRLSLYTNLPPMFNLLLVLLRYRRVTERRTSQRCMNMALVLDVAVKEAKRQKKKSNQNKNKISPLSMLSSSVRSIQAQSMRFHTGKRPKPKPKPKPQAPARIEEADENASSVDTETETPMILGVENMTVEQIEYEVQVCSPLQKQEVVKRGGGRGKFSAVRRCTGAGCRYVSRKATRH